MAGEGATLLRVWEVGKGFPPSARGAALLHAKGEEPPGAGVSSVTEFLAHRCGGRSG